MAKILLVEDDNNLREIYEARLQAEGYTIVSAQDGEEALVVAKAEKPDLIISDVMMPKISGFEMLDIIRNTDGLKDVKIIMLTALGQNDDQQRADRLGANRYLVKSQVTLEDIVRVAQELLNGDAAAPATPATTEPDVSTSAAPVATVEPAAEPVSAPTEPAFEPATEPVNSTPVAATPYPVTPTEAATVVEPTSSNPVATEGNEAQSTASEEANVEAKIDSFVSTPSATTIEPETADTEPEAPALAEAVEPTPAVAPEAEPATEPPTTETTLPNPASEAEDSLTALLNQNAVEVEDKPSTDPNTLQEPVATDMSAVSVAPAHTGGNRVIEPLDSEPKPDLAELVAREEAKDNLGSTTTTPDPTPVIDNEPTATASTQAPAPAPNNPADPNSIAL